MPPYEAEQVLGDLIIADANTLYASDSLTGAVYRYYIDSNEFDILVERGRLGSAQGLVLDKTGAYLYVADYIGGLYRVSLQDGSLFRLAVPDDITDYGIDGLYRDADRLIAIQNGVPSPQCTMYALTVSLPGSVISPRESVYSAPSAIVSPPCTSVTMVWLLPEARYWRQIWTHSTSRR